jgi:hypothetical protein
MDGIKTTRRQTIRETPYGMWVWETDDGGYVSDDEGNFMYVFVDGRNEAVNEAAKLALASEAKALGVKGGKAVFWSGKRPIDDAEYQRQLERHAAGLIADPLDIGAIREEERALHNGR